MLTVALTLALLPNRLDVNPQNALQAFLRAPDGTFSWERETVLSRPAIQLTSQTWHGVTWKHDLVLSMPKEARWPGTALLYVTGWVPNEVDLSWADAFASTAGMPVATLFQIPNQPLWGHTEDDLIAHTFEQYLETGDESWPLLFPMVKSAVRAMDALQASHPEIKRFVVTGASKRGWTSWLVGCAGDRRVAGVAPMVFDFLKMPSQLEKQMKEWGQFSPMIKDYTSRRLEETVESDRGRLLVEMVDPACYLGAYKTPTLVILGSKDPYWTSDAQRVYWPEVKAPKWSLVVPNMGHGWGATEEWTPTLASFAVMCAGGPKLGRIQTVARGGKLALRIAGKPLRIELWRAVSPDLHFSDKDWTLEQRSASAGELRLPLRATSSGSNEALFVRALFLDGASQYWLSSPVWVNAKR